MTSTEPARGPLHGLRVVDAASLYAGPFISTVLADHGADVVKVEPPDGDAYRTGGSPLWPILARGKRSLTLDLRSEEGCDVLRALAAHVDVIVVNLLPPMLEKRGLTWERLSAVNPDLILVCVTSFGLDGPNAELPGSGTLGEAFSGLTHLTGRPDGKPTLASVPVGDAVTGYVGAFGVLAACHERQTGGGGQVVDVNPVDSLLHLTGPALAQWLPGVPPPSRLDGRLAGSPVRNTYRCRDDEWVAISCSTPRHLSQLMELAGGSEPEAADGDHDAAVASWIAGVDREEVIRQLSERRLPVVPVHDAQSLVKDPHVRARQAVRSVTSAEVGERFVAAPAPRFPQQTATAALRCPDLGADTRTVLEGWLGLPPAEVDRLADEGVIRQPDDAVAPSL